MKQYIFITCEGFTQAPWNDKTDSAPEVENAQMLGRVWGENQQKAEQNLLKENPWILEAGFDPYEIIGYELAK
jgi:guanylate kinase